MIDDDEKAAFLRQQKAAEQMLFDREQAIWIALCNDHMKPLPYRGASKPSSYAGIYLVHNIIDGRLKEPHPGAGQYLFNILNGG